MKLDSLHLNNLLTYARERHGAPCRVELGLCAAGDWDEDDPLLCDIYYRDALVWPDGISMPIETILL